MLEVLTKNEQDVMNLLVQGRDFKNITEFLAIDFNQYKIIKKSLFKKLNIKKVVEILPLFIKHNMVDMLY